MSAPLSTGTLWIDPPPEDGDWDEYLAAEAARAIRAGFSRVRYHTREGDTVTAYLKAGRRHTERVLPPAQARLDLD